MSSRVSSASQPAPQGISPGAVDPDRPVDFDSVLSSLGAPDAAPPPLTELLISGRAVPVWRSDDLLSEFPTEAAGADGFPGLSCDLESLTTSRMPPCNLESNRRLNEGEPHVLAALERWLAAIERARDGR